MVTDNERKTESVHSSKKFKSELGEYMWIISYYMKHRNNFLSSKQFQKLINISVSVLLTKNIHKNIGSKLIQYK